MKRYILTGTPGAGKTSIIRALEAEGYPVVEEAATAIIALRQAQGITEPWKSANFIDDIVNLQKQRQMQSAVLPFDVQFHDRSAICCYALSQYLGYAPSPVLLEEIDRLSREDIFQKEVFFIDNLGFCEPTEARKISFEQSLVFEEFHKEAYLYFGYKLVSITKSPMMDRVAAVITKVGNALEV